MTNSWAMLHDEMEEMRDRGYEMTADGIWMGEGSMCSQNDELTRFSRCCNRIIKRYYLLEV